MLLRLIPEKMNDKKAEGLMILASKNNKYYISIKGVSDTASNQKDHCIRLNASEFSVNNTKESAHWQTVEGLGYSGSAMALQPFNTSLEKDITQNPSLEYDFSIENADSALISLYLLPTRPANNQKYLRIGIFLDSGLPELFEFRTEGRSTIWKENVLRNQTIVKMPWKFKTSGKHTLHIIAVDPDVVIDQLLIDFKMNRAFYGVGE